MAALASSVRLLVNFVRSICLGRGHRKPSSSVSRISSVTILVAAICATTLPLPMAYGESKACGRLSAKIEELASKHAGRVAVAVRHLGTGETVRYHADEPMPTASLIKFPILIAARQQLAAGTLKLDQVLELKENDVVPGSGLLTSYFSPGTRLSFGDALRLMMAVSDNTATNLVLDTIGTEATNEAMRNLGCLKTRLHAKVYGGENAWDREGSQKYGLGVTTADEMILLLTMLHTNELVSPEDSQEMRRLMGLCSSRDWFAARLPEKTLVYLKNGGISHARTAAGVIEAPSGSIALCVLTANNQDTSFGDGNAAEQLIAEIARVCFHCLEGTPKVSPPQSPALQTGATGELVIALQRTLNARLSGLPPIAEDGEFGPQTVERVKVFQQSHGLPATGIMDAASWKSLGVLAWDREDPIDVASVNGRTLPRVADDPLSDSPYVTCRTWVIGNPKTGKVLADWDGDRPVDIASTTKLMTAYVVLTSANAFPGLLEETLTFSAAADAVPGSTSGVRADEKLTVKEALYGLLLPSGNDAAHALAEHVGRKLLGQADDRSPVAAFVERMNSAAAELGMASSRFANPHGLTEERHQASAADLFRLAVALLAREDFRTIANTPEYACLLSSEAGYVRPVRWRNTNRLLGLEGYSGLKTGTTSAAGACLVSCGARGGEERVVIVLGSSCSEARYADTLNLYRWSWQRWPPGKTD